jgi:hypothetical protein
MSTSRATSSIIEGSKSRFAKTDNVIISSPVIDPSLKFYIDPGIPASYSGSGTTVNDLSGNAVNATLINGVGYSSTNGGCFTYDGSNDYLSVSSTSAFNLGLGDYTWETWVYLDKSVDTENVYRSLFQIGSNNLGAAIWRSAVNPSTPGAMYSIGGSSQSALIGTDGSGLGYVGPYYRFSARWTQMVFSRNSTLTMLHINGKFWQSISSPTYTNANAAMTYGLQTGNNYLNGRSSIMRMYQRCLSDAEIMQNYYSAALRFST